MKTRNYLNVFFLLFLMTCMIDSSLSKELTVVINGISGEIIENPMTKPNLEANIVRPGDAVKVKIVNANLIHYKYEIIQSSNEELSINYSIAGFGVVGDLQAIDTSGFLPDSKASIMDVFKQIEISPSPQLSDLLKDYLNTTQQVTNIGMLISKEVYKIQKINDNIDGIWPRQPEDDWPSDLEETIDYVKLSDGLTEICQQIDSTKLKLSYFILENSRKLLSATDTETKKLENENKFAEVLNAHSEINKNKIGELQNLLDKTQKMLDRWASIIKAHPKPVLTQSFPTDQISRRYTIKIQRTALSEEAQAIQQSTDKDEKGKILPSTIASFSFESHAWHRLNVSLGLAGVYKPDCREYSIVPSISDDGTKTFSVQESKKSQFSICPVASLGIYFNRVDYYNPDRPPAWMGILGVEISSSPKQYFAGLGVDFKGGWLIQAGFTHYSGTTLSDDWKVDQAVPSTDDGKALVETVPVKSRDNIGAFFSVSFRPGIFKAFSSLQKSD